MTMMVEAAVTRFYQNFGQRPALTAYIHIRQRWWLVMTFLKADFKKRRRHLNVFLVQHYVVNVHVSTCTCDWPGNTYQRWDALSLLGKPLEAGLSYLCWQRSIKCYTTTQRKFENTEKLDPQAIILPAWTTFFLVLSVSRCFSHN